MEQWKEYKLGEICSMKNGKKRPKTEGSYPVFGGNGIMGYSNEYNAENTIIVGRVGAYCGNVFLNKGQCWVSDNAISVIANENTDTNFLYYLMLILDLHNQHIGAAQPLMTQDIIGRFNVNIPPLSTQKQIAYILSTLDSKIEVNRKINRNLEKLVKVLFKSWQDNIQGHPHHVMSLNDVATFIGGYSYKGNELVPSRQAMATIKNFNRNGGFKLDGYKEIVPSDKIKQEQYANLYDILVAHTDLTQNADVIGNAEMVLSLGVYKRILFSMDLVKVVPNKSFPYRFFLLALLQDENFKSHCLGYVNGTTVLHLSKKALPNYEFIVANDIKEISLLDTSLSKIYKKQSKIIAENIRLSSIRNTLLPKLISGELAI